MAEIAGASELLEKLQVDDNKTEDEGKIEKFYRDEDIEPVFPMSDDYKRDGFFVRQCYLDRTADIDMHVDNYLQGIRAVKKLLILGTPG